MNGSAECSTTITAARRDARPRDLAQLTRDAQWRIGWAAFDSAFDHVIERSDVPLVKPEGSHDGATDIAFAASAVETAAGILLYYSQSDQQLRRVTIRRS